MSPRPRFAALDPERSAAILRAAAEEIGERGVEGASYNRIIERSGVSKGAMYYYFDDKHDLLRTVVADAGERAAAAIGALDAFDDARSFWDALLALYARVTDFFAAEPARARLLVAALAQPPGSEVAVLLAEYTERMRRWLAAVLEAGVRVGAVRDDLPTALQVELVLAVGESVDRWNLARWEALTPREVGELARQMLDLHQRLIAPLPLLAVRDTERETGGER